MRNKLNKNKSSKLILISICVIMLVGFAFIVPALTDNEKTALQQELSQLEANLSSQGYGWLIDYSVNYSSISNPEAAVFRQGSNEEIARFTNITGSFEKHQIFLTALGDNESYDVFDLRSMRDADKMMPWNIFLMKIRIEQIKEMLKNG